MYRGVMGIFEDFDSCDSNHAQSQREREENGEYYAICPHCGESYWVEDGHQCPEYDRCEPN